MPDVAGSGGGGSGGANSDGSSPDRPPDAPVPDASGDVSHDGARSTPKLTWTLMVSGWDADFISGAANGEIWSASKPSSVLQVGADGTKSTSSLALLNSAYVTGLWVAGPGNAYASAYANVVLHWDGSGSWKRDVMNSGTIFNSVWGAGPSDVYAVTDLGVYHSTGDDKWVLQPITQPTLSGLGWLTGTGPTDLWLAGDHGEMFRSTGDGTWRQEIATGVYYVNQLWAASPSEAYFVTYGSVMHRAPSTGRWAAETTPLASSDLMYGVWGSGPNDVYVGADHNHLLHSVGDGSWEDEGFAPGVANVSIKAIWGRSASDVYLGTSNGIYHGVP
ncbi:MAG TPA: hypothetical protein VIF57_06200 [Polyangia bacterium]